MSLLNYVAKKVITTSLFILLTVAVPALAWRFNLRYALSLSLIWGMVVGFSLYFQFTLR